MSLLLFILIIIPVTLLLLSVFLLRKWKKASMFFLLNILLGIVYTIYIINGDLNYFIGHDEYGTQRLFLLFITPIIHTIIILLFSILMFIFIKKKNTN